MLLWSFDLFTIADHFTRFDCRIRIDQTVMFDHSAACFRIRLVRTRQTFTRTFFSLNPRCSFDWEATYCTGTT